MVKYITNAQALADYILKQHGLNHRFSKTTLNMWMRKNNITNHSIHYLTLTGCLKRIELGQYILVWHTADMSAKIKAATNAYRELCAETSKKSTVAVKRRPKTGEPRTEGIKEESGTPIIRVRPTENDAIALLKSLGYKIMKPVHQYEEV